MSEPFEPARPASVVSPALERPLSFVDEDGPDTSSSFLPILILALVMLAWFGFQATQLRVERDAIHDAAAAQGKRIDDATKMLGSLDAIARGTAQLADAGNPSARLIVDELKKRGITIAPTQPVAPPAPAGKP